MDKVEGKLASLAEKYGVATGFWDWRGESREASVATIVQVLRALGVAASTADEIESALIAHDEGPWRHLLPPCTVLRHGNETLVNVHVPDGTPVKVWIDLEDGGTRHLEQRDIYTQPRMIDEILVGRAVFAIPEDLPLGWHEICAASSSGVTSRPVAIVPPRIDARVGAHSRREWGFQTQLYSVRSARSWGIGDFADLAEIASFSGRLGAGFVLINPLHAAEPIIPMTPSPYLPTTRRFVNPIYIRIEDIYETAYVPAGERSLIDWQAETVVPHDHDSSILDRDQVWTAKKTALEVVFEVPRSLARQSAFDHYRDGEGEGLVDFATWCALIEHFELPPEVDLPAEFRDSRSPKVAAMREALAERVEFYQWMQWVCDEQLAVAQSCARASGMEIGVIEDLAVGVHAQGADVWAMPDVFASGVTVGAPPDMFNQQGQNWSQPPWSPTGLAAQGYRPFRDLLRTVFRHAGAVRIDHILGLFRLWWVPQGQCADEGAYVYYDHEALVGILCLEAHRAGVMVIGEDLGVVEPWVRDYLRDRGILGTSVLWFEKEGESLRAPEHWRQLALATVTTHDLPPTAGYLAGEHVEIRDRLGLLTEPIEQVRRVDRAEQRAVFDDLERRGLIGADATERERVEALHRFVCLTPSRLIGVALTDAVGERRAQNQPGTDREYPNWKIPLADSAEQVVLVEDLPNSARLRSLVSVLELR